MLSVFIVLTVLLVLYTVVNPKHIVGAYYQINSSKLNTDVKILYVSDIHYGCVQDKSVVDTALAQLADEEFDVILLGGDIVQCPVTSKSDMLRVMSELGELRSKYGTYFVYGNHDAHDDGTAFDKPKHYDIFDSDDIIDALCSNGIKILNDESALLDNGILLIGRSNSFDNQKRVPVSNLVTVDNAFVLCMDHAPIEMSECSQAGVDLQVSGHTHGGQLFPINVLEPIIWKMPSYGLKTYGDMKLIVSSGMGIGAYPLRNAHCCEYVVINIISDKEDVYGS